MSERWSAPGGPKVDDFSLSADPPSDALAVSYEELRRLALSEGVLRAGLGAGLLVSKGMVAWVRGWKACVPVPPSPTRVPCQAASADVVAVLAAMAIACA